MDVEVPGGERGNIQTGGGGDKVSTISLLGCSTSVALATGPTDEEEEVLLQNRISYTFLCYDAMFNTYSVFRFVKPTNILL